MFLVISSPIDHIVQDNKEILIKIYNLFSFNPIFFFVV